MKQETDENTERKFARSAEMIVMGNSHIHCYYGSRALCWALIAFSVS
jgi:hypothetical protein